MKKILLTLFLSFCVLSCAKTQSLGAGVSVDAQGNLKIDAPLYVIDKNAEKPVLKRAPASMNLPVYAGIPVEDSSYPLEVTGGIIKGHITITIKRPDENLIEGAFYYWGIPGDLFMNGADVDVGELYLTIEGPDYYHPIILYPNLHAKILTEKGYHGKTYYYIESDHYEHVYSLGDINISGKFNLSYWTEHKEFDIRFTRGWNVIRQGGFFNIYDNDFTTKTSTLPPSEAVWVLFD
jgi:hypothetical protein